MIFVTGATGNAGGAVARALAARGEPVRALIRGESDGESLPEGAEGFVGDLNRPETLAAGLGGVSAAFLLSGYDGLAETLDEMRQAGVERVVLLSSSAAPRGDLSNAVARYHILSERAVADSGLPWTFLQPNSFMSNTLRWLPQLESGDVVRGPWPDVRIAMIHPDDLGAVAADALCSDAHAGHAYRLSGPESLRPADQVQIVAEATGREIRFEAQSDEEAREEMSAAMPAEYVDAFFDFFSAGNIDESEVLPTVEEITGAAPRTLRQWARENAESFARPGA
jgi:uncharacterized protein YbjT (DUF2867 family)